MPKQALLRKQEELSKGSPQPIGSMKKLLLGLIVQQLLGEVIDEEGPEYVEIRNESITDVSRSRCGRFYIYFLLIYIYIHICVCVSVYVYTLM